MPKHNGKHFKEVIFCILFIIQSIWYYLEVTYDYQTEKKALVNGSYWYTDFRPNVQYMMFSEDFCQIESLVELRPVR